MASPVTPHWVNFPGHSTVLSLLHTKYHRLLGNIDPAACWTSCLDDNSVTSLPSEDVAMFMAWLLFITARDQLMIYKCCFNGLRKPKEFVFTFCLTPLLLYALQNTCTQAHTLCVQNK